jgi:arginine/ornithine N-succinyltransferase beta subunit
MKSATADGEINPIAKKSAYWQGTVDFHEMFNLCLEHGDNIIVGFTGGINAFASSPFLELQSRRFFRWDYAKNTMGKKKADWLSGSMVIELLRQHHGYPNNQG